MTIFVPPEWEEVIQAHLNAGCLTGADQRGSPKSEAGNWLKIFLSPAKVMSPEILKQEQQQSLDCPSGELCLSEGLRGIQQ